MNYIQIKQFSDFEELLNIDILITGDLMKQNEEREYNTWCISFDQAFIKSIKLPDLYNFLEILIKNRSQQVKKMKNGPATFYLWYDKQSFNLCFDILSGNNLKMPFDCITIIKHTPHDILTNLLNDTQADTNYLSWENITILNPGDPGCDDDDDEEYDNSKYVLDVYVITLPQSTLSNLLKHFIS
jgi:hypothetical protein